MTLILLSLLIANSLQAQVPTPSPLASVVVSPSSLPSPVIVPIIHIHWVKGNQFFKTENPNHRVAIQELLEKGATPQLEVLRNLMKVLPQSERFRQAQQTLAKNSWTGSLQLSFHYDDIDPFETLAPGKLWFVAEPSYLPGQEIPKILPPIYQIKIWKNLKDSQIDIEAKLEQGAKAVSELENRKKNAQEIISVIQTPEATKQSRP